MSLAIKAIEFGGRDQRVERGASISPSVRAEVQEAFATERLRSRRAFESVIVDLNCAVADINVSACYKLSE